MQKSLELVLQGEIRSLVIKRDMSTKALKHLDCYPSIGRVDKTSKGVTGD